MAARIIDGKAIAAQVRAEVAERVARAGVTPGFVDLLIGEDPASATYVRMKNKAAVAAGMVAFDRVLPADAKRDEILRAVDELNADPNVHGIIVQLPLPKVCDADPFEIQCAILPSKDVDGLHPENQGLLAMGRPRFVPATPAGVVELLHRGEVDVEGRHVVVVGRSNLVGRPLSILLSQKGPGLNATVTLCHTGTRDIGSHTREADIIVVAAGHAKALTADMVKPGAVVIDVGTNKGPEGGLIGDVDFGPVSEIASAITPVPGGVGPMTVAMLIDNVARAARA
ncbi:MAG: bifunctional 5,10-methylenetetrahydrofolate dehydrogenase/5,10-methenyltetrahydrofolate cyclohydrolase [Actinomycetota bacterium]